MTSEELREEDIKFKKLADEFNKKRASDLSNEGAISLAEAILSEIRLEIKHVVAAHRISPDSIEVQAAVKNMDNLLGSDYFNILTMGHGDSVHESFRRDCGIKNEVKQVG